MSSWNNAKDRYFKYFAAFYYAGILTYNHSTGRFSNNLTGVTYLPKKSGNGRTQISMYLKRRQGKVRQITILAYRLAWRLFKGPLHPGEQINHKDGNKGNDRLRNLEVTDNSGNQKHSYATGLHPKFTGEKGHTAKLTNKQGRKIHRLANSGKYLQREIAAMFDISITSVSNIKHGFSWSTVNNIQRRRIRKSHKKEYTHVY